MMEITRKGITTTVEGTQPQVGDMAPDFNLPNIDDTTTSLQDLKGKKAIVSVFPDINTRVCDLQTRNFFKLASTLTNTVIVNVSNNSIDQLKDWCAVADIDALMLSDVSLEFAKAYGLFMPEYNVLARSVFVLDENGKLLYAQICPEMSQEPDYQAALAALK